MIDRRVRDDKWAVGTLPPGQVVTIPRKDTDTGMRRVICGARKVDGTPCHGQPKTGEPRCRIHMGRPPKTGLYSRYIGGRLGKEIARYERDPDPLNVYRELAMLRALLERWVTVNRDRLMDMKFEVDGKDGKVLLDPTPILENAYKLSDNIIKQVSRIERIRNLNALSLPELSILLKKLAAVIERVVVEPDKLALIAQEWQALLADVQSGRAKKAEEASAVWAAGEEAE